MPSSLQHGYSAAVLDDVDKALEKASEEIGLEPHRLQGAIRELGVVERRIHELMKLARKDLDDNKMSDKEFDIAHRTLQIAAGQLATHADGLKVRIYETNGQIAGLRFARKIVSNQHDEQRREQTRVKAIEDEAEASDGEEVQGGKLSEKDTRFGGKMAQAAKRFNRNKPKEAAEPKEELVVVDEAAADRFKATYTQKQLQEMAREMGVSSSGSKGDIVKRILLSGKDIPKNGAALPAG